MSHAALPWKLDHPDSANIYSTVGEKEKVACHCCMELADADFIILACNSYYELLSALKKIASGKFAGFEKQVAFAALAKAKGE